MAQHQLGRSAGPRPPSSKCVGETVPQHGGVKWHPQARAPPVRREFSIRPAAERAAPPVDKSGGEFTCFPAVPAWAGVAKITIDKRKRLFPDGDDPFLVALSDAADAADRAVQIHHAQTDQFENAQAGRNREPVESWRVAKPDWDVLVVGLG